MVVKTEARRQESHRVVRQGETVWALLRVAGPMGSDPLEDRKEPFCHPHENRSEVLAIQVSGRS